MTVASTFQLWNAPDTSGFVLISKPKYLSLNFIIYYYKTLHNHSNHCFSSVLATSFKLEAEIKCKLSCASCAYTLDVALKDTYVTTASILSYVTLLL